MQLVAAVLCSFVVPFHLQLVGISGVVPSSDPVGRIVLASFSMGVGRIAMAILLVGTG